MLWLGVRVGVRVWLRIRIYGNGVRDRFMVRGLLLGLEFRLALGLGLGVRGLELVLGYTFSIRLRQGITRVRVSLRG